MHVPFFSLEAQHQRIQIELERSFHQVMDGPRFILSGQVSAFEQEYAAYSGTSHCVGVANGFDALFAALKVLGVEAGDEVIVPAMTCVPTWMAVSKTGATLVPVDADDTFSIDVKHMKEMVTARTKAIVPVNLFGNPASLEEIIQFTSERNIFVVEDNAQGHGASIGGRKTGSFGIVNATSFYPTKNLGALGDGGAVTTSDSSLAEKIRMFCNYGAAARFQHEVMGINSRLDELQAAFLRVKLQHLDAWNIERAQLATIYRKLLSGVGDLRWPKEREGFRSAHHLLVVRTREREALRRFLKEHDVETDVHYPLPPHRQEVYRGVFPTVSFPETENICETIVSLPLWPGLREAQVEYTCDCIRRFFQS